MNSRMINILTAIALFAIAIYVYVTDKANDGNWIIFLILGGVFAGMGYTNKWSNNLRQKNKPLWMIIVLVSILIALIALVGLILNSQGQV